MSLSSTTPGVCTLSGNTVTGVATGTCVIAANQAGDANYNPAPQVTQSIPVGALAWQLSVTKVGSGTVTSNPAGINCGATCSAAFNSGTVVSLTAAPAAGSAFAGWSGACTGTGTCQVTMNAAANVIATFNTSSGNTYSLTVTKKGSGSGRVTSSPAGIDCGSLCAGNFTANSLVTLTASVSAGSKFGGWDGACSGKNLTCSVRMSRARSVIAKFERL